MLVSSLVNALCMFLYPAYATYKALARRPVSAQDADLERWLQYWALVGAWSAIEGAVGWVLTWLPFYTLCKTALFFYLAVSARGTPYLYNSTLAPLFAEHEPAIDEFINSLRGQAGAHARGGLGALYDLVMRLFGPRIAPILGVLARFLPGGCAVMIRPILSLSQQQQAVQPGYGQPQGQQPFSGPAQPPTLADPASGAAQQVFGLVSQLAGRYMPQALAAAQAMSASAQQATSRGFDVPGHTSRTTAFAAEETVSASIHPLESRTPSDNSLSGGSASNLASSFTEIRKEDAEGAPPNPRRTSSSSWMSWSKNKTE